MARPRKYSEKTAVISSVVPVSILELLDKQRGQMTRSEYIATLIVSADKELADELKNEINFWKQKATELEKQLRNTQDKIDNLLNQTNKIKNNAVSYIFELPEIPEADEVINQELPRITKYIYEQTKYSVMDSETELDNLLNHYLINESKSLAYILENRLAVSGKAVKNRKILQKVIINKLAGYKDKIKNELEVKVRA